MKSMTAYGRSLHRSAFGQWVIEIHSVNKKTLDFFLLIPKELLQFDLEIRKWISSVVQRGQITVRMNLCHACEDSLVWLRRTEQLKVLKESMEKAALSIGISTETLTFPFLYEQMKETSCLDFLGQEDLMKKDLQQGVELALQGFLAMKQVEGAHLAVEFQKHLQVVLELVEKVQERSGGSTERYRKKMLERLADYKMLSEEDQERVLREAFLYAEKIDVTEELERLRSHVRQFLLLLESPEESIGKTLEFLTQEMGREANTLLSKADDLDVSFWGLKIKGEIEKIREQVQNVE